MPNIKKEIDTLKAKLARLEKEQEKAARESQAVKQASDEIDKILKQQDISLESYIAHNLKKISRIVNKLEQPQQDTQGKATTKKTRKKVTRKKRAVRTPSVTVKIPAGSYSKLPDNPDQVYVVKEKGPRPKALKAYAEQVGLEAFLEQCRID
jgi:dsDNA-specific endonuclease/ATPase MutS2